MGKRACGMGQIWIQRIPSSGNTVCHRHYVPGMELSALWSLCVIILKPTPQNPVLVGTEYGRQQYREVSKASCGEGTLAVCPRCV